MLGKFSSSLKERLEGVLASSTFESKLYKATSNSIASPPTTAELYAIADHSFVRDDLVKILVTLKQRLESSQREKWKRLRKTLQLAEFLLVHGSLEFAAYLAERLVPLIARYADYECEEGYEDRGLCVRNCAQRISELCADREKLRQARAEGKKMRARFAGISSDGREWGNAVTRGEAEELPPSAARLHRLFETVQTASETLEESTPPRPAELIAAKVVPPPRRVKPASPEPNFLD